MQRHRIGERPRPVVRRRWMANLMLAGASLLATLLTLEVVVRIVFTEERPLFIKDPVVGDRYRPNFAGLRVVPEGGRQVYLRFNQLGYRGPDYSHEKPPGTARVIVLGDSFVAGLAVEEQDTLPAYLERQLNDDGSRQTWQAMNFGIGGYSTAQSLLTWRTFAHDFQADLVVLCLFIGNDIVDNSSELTNYPRPYFSLDSAGELVAPPAAGGLNGFTQWLNDHSALYVWQKLRFRSLRSGFRRLTVEPRDAGGVYDTHVRPDYERAWQLTEKLIEVLAAEVRAAGAALLLATIPSNEQCIESDWQEILSHADVTAALDRTYPDSRLSTFAVRHGIAFVAVLDACRAFPQPQDLYLPYGHWSAKGNQLGAATIHDAIRAQHLVPP